MPLDPKEFDTALDELGNEDSFGHGGQALEVIVDEMSGAITAFYKDYSDLVNGKPTELWGSTFEDIDDLADWINKPIHKQEQIFYQIKKRREDGTLDHIGNLMYYTEFDGYAREDVAKPDEFFDELEARVKGRLG